VRASAAAGVRADAADTEWCALRGASVVGVRHRVSGAPSQDAWAWGGDDDRVVVAVADGLGAFESSGVVAAVVAEAAVGAALADVAAGASAAQALAAGVEAANRAVAEVSTGASTLVLAVVERDGTVELARVGDSTAFCLSQGVWAEVFDDAQEADADEDGVRTPVTAALPDPRPAQESARGSLAPGDVLVLVSAGVGDPLRDGPTTVAPGLAAALADPPHPLALAAQADFSRQGCADDRTIVGVWRAPLAPPLPSA
jgi:serine/threonine protein phosphatase PrpC